MKRSIFIKKKTDVHFLKRKHLIEIQLNKIKHLTVID